MELTNILLALILLALLALIFVTWRAGRQVVAFLDSLGNMTGDMLRAILNEIGNREK